MSATAALGQPALTISSSVHERSDELARTFVEAQPFPYVVVDEFLDHDVCRQLLEAFPSFEDRYARNEFGEVGGKAVRMDVRDIAPVFRALDAYIQTPDFLDLISKITGIPDLLYDPDYVGGGTHENVQGQGLDPHVDFNYHPGTGWHRRLNLIVYLNPEWDETWGGGLELHSDPWDATRNISKSIAPLFNRCVIFETSEVSWHGFRRIALPPNRAELSRKSFAIYLYTRERPPQQTAPPHATIYVPDGMPDHLTQGSALSQSDVELLINRFAHLRQQLKFLYQRELHFGAQIQVLEGALAEARASQGFPLQGYAVPVGCLTGYWPDGWAGPSVTFEFETTMPVKALELDVWAPPALKGDQVLKLSVGGEHHEVRIAPGSRSRIELSLVLSKGGTVEVSIDATRSWRPKDSGESSDERPLAWRLIEARLLHR